MTFSTALLLSLCILAPQPDVLPAGHKSVDLQVSIENPREFDSWQIVAATHFGPAHITTVEPHVPFPYSAKYGTTVYAIPRGTPIPGPSPAGKSPQAAAFQGFPSTRPPVNIASTIAASSPIGRALTSLRIVSISSAGIEFETMRTLRFDSKGKPVGWFRLWAFKLGIAALGLLGLLILRRSRLKRASA